MINRHYQNLSEYLKPGKVLILQGPRQVGKTTLVQNWLESPACQEKHVYLTGDSIEAQTVFSSRSLELIKDFAAGYTLIVIDEAQKIQDIGVGLKLLVDQVPGIKVIATGSSAFDLAQKVGEPLVGRAVNLKLYPISVMELSQNGTNDFELKQKLNELLTYGMYPEVLTEAGTQAKKDYLHDLVDMYLLKDVLEFGGLKGSKFIVNLLKLLAFQIGSLVSLSELATQLSVNVRTIERYLDLLEKSYIIRSLWGYSRNLRKEITKKNKYYFYDVGVRNALIGNFNEPFLRLDKGGLWENFLVMERLKRQEYGRLYANNYFWCTWEHKEIDWVEEREGKLFGYEFKWDAAKAKVPSEFISTYPGATVELVDPNNYLDFVRG